MKVGNRTNIKGIWRVENFLLVLGVYWFIFRRRDSFRCRGVKCWAGAVGAKLARVARAKTETTPSPRFYETSPCNTRGGMVIIGETNQRGNSRDEEGKRTQVGLSCWCSQPSLLSFFSTIATYLTDDNINANIHLSTYKSYRCLECWVAFDAL